MVRSLYRIFLVAGIVSVFSFGCVNDAMAEKCNTVDAGRYCLEKGKKRPCPEGCYCDGGKNVNAVADIGGLSNHAAVKHACSLRYSGVKAELEEAGIHYCPEEGQTTFESSDDNSGSGADEESDCKDGYTAMDGSVNCTNDVNAGRYCFKKGNRRDCPEGCYCEGKKDAIGEQWLDGSTWKTLQVKSWCNGHMNGSNSAHLSDYLEQRGIHYCPPEFPKSYAKKSKKEDCYAFINSYRVFYMEISCLPGTYLPSIISDEACPDGYNVGLVDTGDALFSTYGCSSTNGGKASFVCKSCTDGYYCEGYNGPVGTSTGDDKGIEKCPDGGTSDAGAKSITECYRNCEGNTKGFWDGKEYKCTPGGSGGSGDLQEYVSCNPGYYVPAHHNKCDARCNGSFKCPGGEKCLVNQDTPQCRERCPSGYINNSDHTECVPKGTTGGGQGGSENGKTCDNGSYYDGEDCVTCPAGAYCKAGKARKCGPRGFSAAGAPECTKCGDGLMANEDRTGCERALITVPAGSYLPEGRVTPEDNCPTGKFCPGGKWRYSSGSDKGAFACPPLLTSLSGSPSSDRKDCNVNLTKDQMAHSIVGNKNCWKYATKENYVNCIFAGSGAIESIKDEEGITWNEEALVETDEVVVDHTSDGNYNSSGTTPAVPTVPENPRTPAEKYDIAVSVNNDKSLAVSTGNAEVGTANTTDYVAKAPDTLKQVSPGEPVKATPLLNATMVGGKNLTASPARSLRPTRSVRKR